LRNTNNRYCINSYLELFRYYQLLELEVTESRDIIKKTKDFINILDTKYGAILMPNSKEISNLKENFIRLGDSKLEQQYLDLGHYLNAGNLRHVVYTLYTEENLTAKEFGEKINFTEQEIIDLTRNGIVTYNLLNAICNYFRILKTSDLYKYVS